MPTEMKLPQIGEEVESAVVLSVLVDAGQTVTKGDPVLELESDKATTEVPASRSGVVTKILVEKGEEVRAGQAILQLEDQADAADDEEGEGQEEEEEDEGEREEDEGEEDEGEREEEEEEDEDEEDEGEREEDEEEPKEDVDVDTSMAARPREDAGARREESDAPPDDRAEARADDRRDGTSPRGDGRTRRALASPKVRRIARELGVDVEVDGIVGTGTHGRVTADDVRSHVRRIVERARKAPVEAPLPDFSVYGPTDRIPLRAWRRTIAENVTAGWKIPQVTQFDRADASALERFREGLVGEDDGPTITSILIAVVARVLPRFPRFNASLDPRAAELVLKRYVHIGVAVDTEHGLVVPVIRDADRKDLGEISTELRALARAARERKLDAESLAGASFTVTNLGGLGTTRFTPLVTPPLVAVLDVGAVETRPVHRNGGFEPRPFLPLGVSYDHRVVDGADAARLLRAICETVAEPMRLLVSISRPR